MNEYAVVFEQADDGGWSAYTLDLPCVAAGDSRAEAEVRIREAIALYREELTASSQPLPPRRSDVAVISA